MSPDRESDATQALMGSSEDPAYWLDLIERHAGRAGRPAISRRRFDGSFEETTHAALAEDARKLARVFQESTSPGQIIPLCLSRTADCIAAMLGALLSNRAFCCVNPKLRLPQIEQILLQTQAPLALVDETGLMALRGDIAAASALRKARWLLMGAERLSRPGKKIAEQFANGSSLTPWDAAGAEAWGGPSGEAPQPLGCCLFTSGSTGMPKGVLVARADLAARARAEVEWFGLSASDVLLNILPFSFDVGLNQLLSALVSGAELVVLESWFAADILKVSALRGVTGISAVPSIWSDFARNGKHFDRADLHRALRYVTVSGGDLSPAQHRLLPELVQGAEVFKTYGQTEAFRLTSLRPEEYTARPTSVGRAFSGVQVHIVRDDGSRAAPLEPGEVVHTGLGAMLGYLDGNDPERKLRDNPFRDAGSPHPTAVFTGDIGYLDEEGFLFLSGRRDDLLKIHGNRVYPSEIRDQIAEMPDVAAVEVVAVKMPDKAQLAAFIVPRADRTLDERRVRLQLTQRLPTYMLPDLIVLLAALPRTASGKPDRPSLAAQAREMLEDR